MGGVREFTEAEKAVVLALSEAVDRFKALPDLEDAEEFVKLLWKAERIVRWRRIRGEVGRILKEVEEMGD